MKVNNQEYGFTIEPSGNKVRVLIHRIGVHLFFKGKEVYFTIQQKSFGRWFREPTKKDYEKARKWADDQLQNIFHANKDIFGE